MVCSLCWLVVLKVRPVKDRIAHLCLQLSLHSLTSIPLFARRSNFTLSSLIFTSYFRCMFAASFPTKITPTQLLFCLFLNLLQIRSLHRSRNSVCSLHAPFGHTKHDQALFGSKLFSRIYQTAVAFFSINVAVSHWMFSFMKNSIQKSLSGLAGRMLLMLIWLVG